VCYNSLLINDRYNSIQHAVYSTVIKLYFMYITWRSIESVTGFTLLDTLSNFGCVCSEISRTYCWKNVINRDISKRCWKYNEISPIVQASYRSKPIDFSLEILRDFSMKIRKDKERNSRISLALLLHSTVTKEKREHHLLPSPSHTVFTRVSVKLLRPKNQSKKSPRLIWVKTWHPSISYIISITLSFNVDKWHHSLQHMFA